MSRRVVITGAGAITPLALSAEETWQAAKNGKCGVGLITAFDASQHLVKIAAEVKGFDPTRYMDVKEARRRDRFEQMATAAAKEALAHSGLTITDANAGRVGVFVGSGGGGLISFQEAVETVNTSGPRRVDPFTISKLMANGASGLI